MLEGVARVCMTGIERNGKTHLLVSGWRRLTEGTDGEELGWWRAWVVKSKDDEALDGVDVGG